MLGAGTEGGDGGDLSLHVRRLVQSLKVALKRDKFKRRNKVKVNLDVIVGIRMKLDLIDTTAEV